MLAKYILYVTAGLPSRSISTLIVGRRHLWEWLNVFFNRFDSDRVKQVGPDCAAAEWLLRCGASVRWMGETQLLADYNSLPHIASPDEPLNLSQYKIEEIDATESCIVASGFRHLDGLTGVKKIKLHKCNSMEDSALGALKHVKDSLIWLQVSSCGNVTNHGLMKLGDLKNLQHLHLYDLQEVTDLRETAQALKSSLPTCDVKVSDAV